MDRLAVRMTTVVVRLREEDRDWLLRVGPWTYETQPIRVLNALKAAKPMPTSLREDPEDR
jgi:hypothetical protein